MKKFLDKITGLKKFWNISTKFFEVMFYSDTHHFFHEYSFRYPLHLYFSQIFWNNPFSSVFRQQRYFFYSVWSSQQGDKTYRMSKKSRDGWIFPQVKYFSKKWRSFLKYFSTGNSMVTFILTMKLTFMAFSGSTLFFKMETPFFTSAIDRAENSTFKHVPKS